MKRGTLLIKGVIKEDLTMKGVFIGIYICGFVDWILLLVLFHLLPLGRIWQGLLLGLMGLAKIIIGVIGNVLIKKSPRFL